ncbi:hypothetical protein [Nocardia sp. NPDC127526]|uniref:hypothetical protein n=1 Tax=Nocardia sp. NPDC127526 TaxID=3345393 RepID=UPI003632A966
MGMHSGEPGPAEQGLIEVEAILVAVLSVIRPNSKLSAHDILRELADEMEEPPTPGQITEALGLLSEPVLGYKPGEPVHDVIDRLYGIAQWLDGQRLDDDNGLG